MVGWALEREEIEQSPIMGMKPPESAPSRDRVLADDELALAWRAAGALPYPFGPLYRLLLATGQRGSVQRDLWRRLERTLSPRTSLSLRSSNDIERRTQQDGWSHQGWLVLDVGWLAVFRGSRP